MDRSKTISLRFFLLSLEVAQSTPQRLEASRLQTQPREVRLQPLNYRSGLGGRHLLVCLDLFDLLEAGCADTVEAETSLKRLRRPTYCSGC